MIRNCFNILFFLLLTIPSAMAQTEAQGAQEVMVFDHKQNNKTIEIRKGDRVIVPKGKDGQPSIKGNVTRFTAEGFEIYNKSKNQTYNLDLTKLNSISVGVNQAMVVGGVLLTIAGTFSLVIALGSLVVLALFGSGIGAFIAIPIVGLLLAVGMMALGIWLMVHSVNKLILRLWTRRLVRRQKIIIKKKKG